jgi:hypothetical protein
VVPFPIYFRSDDDNLLHRFPSLRHSYFELDPTNKFDVRRLAVLIVVVDNKDEGVE